MIVSLFFTRNVSLKEWSEKGLISREIELYNQLLNSGRVTKVILFTYGSGADQTILSRLKNEGQIHQGIVLREKPKILKGKFGSVLHSLIMPYIYFSDIKTSDILKTNQIDGGWTAYIASLIFPKKRLVARCGYVISSLESKLSSQYSIKSCFYRFIERILFSSADICVFASEDDKNYSLIKYKLDDRKLKVAFNYINEKKFENKKQIREEKFVFVGRIEPVKNLENVINALSKTNFHLDIYGDGTLKRYLDEYCIKNKLNVTFKGVVDNNLLPTILNKYKYYIQCSLQEGMPKTIIEAMASGCICLGSNVKGINEVIIDRETGYLSVNTDQHSIFEAISRITDKRNNIIINNSEGYIMKNFSLTNYVEKEINEIYQYN